MSRRFCLFRPFWPCVPLLGVFPGCHSGPRAFLGFSLDLLRPFLGTRGGKGFRVLLLFCFSFPLLFCGHTFSRLTGGGLTNPAVVSPAPRPSEGQGVPIFGRGHIGRPLFRDFVGIFCCLWGQGPTDAWRPGPFCVGRGPFACPLTGPFHTARFFPPQVFFFSFFSALGATLAEDSLLVACMLFCVHSTWSCGMACQSRLYSSDEIPIATPWRVAPKIPRNSPKNPATLFLCGFL